MKGLLEIGKPFFCTVIVVLLLCSVLTSDTVKTAVKKGDLLIGVKIYEYKNDYSVLFKEWKTLGINTAFIGTSLATKKGFVNGAKKNNIKTFIIVPIFCSLDKPLDNKDMYAVTGEGKMAHAEWVHFVCPIRENYRNKKIEYIIDLIKKYNPDGISIDFIRYFVYWEKVHPDATLNPLTSTCFCSLCLNRFQKDLNIRIPETVKGTRKNAEWILKNHKKKWVEWKCNVITSMVEDIAREAKKLKPDILLNLHLVPWRKHDYGNGIRTVAGQDISKIVPFVDYISPMCYAHMLKQKPPWIHSVVKDIGEQTETRILPSIQVKESYLKEKLSVEVFKNSLHEALKPPSMGVVFWNWKFLSEDLEKKKSVKFIKK